MAWIGDFVLSVIVLSPWWYGVTCDFLITVIELPRGLYRVVIWVIRMSLFVHYFVKSQFTTQYIVSHIRQKSKRGFPL